MGTQEQPICVIEDNTPIRKLFCTLLGKAGFHTIEFSDGNSFYEWLKNNKTSGVLMDILLPDTSGTELIKSIRNMPNGEKIPIIAVTGFAQAQDRENFLDLGFDSYISKPVNTATFVEEVRSALETGHAV